MDGISRAAGSPVHISFQGRDYRIYGLVAEDWGTVEQYILSQRPNVLAIAQNAAIETAERAEQHALTLPDQAARERYLKQVQRVIDKSMEIAVASARENNTVSGEEVFEFLQTPRGVAFMFWVAFEKSYPGQFKLNDMYAIFETMAEETREKLASQLGAASGVDAVGNSTGPTSQPN
jgi:hypothetical protein